MLCQVMIVAIRQQAVTRALYKNYSRPNIRVCVNKIKDMYALMNGCYQWCYCCRCSDKFTRFCQWKNLELNIQVFSLCSIYFYKPDMFSSNSCLIIITDQSWEGWLECKKNLLNRSKGFLKPR